MQRREPDRPSIPPQPTGPSRSGDAVISVSGRLGSTLEYAPRDETLSRQGLRPDSMATYPSKLSFAAFLQYSPRGTSVISKQSKDVKLVNQGRPLHP